MSLTVDPTHLGLFLSVTLPTAWLNLRVTFHHSIPLPKVVISTYLLMLGWQSVIATGRKAMVNHGYGPELVSTWFLAHPNKQIVRIFHLVRTNETAIHLIHSRC